MSILIPETPMGRGWADIYIIRRTVRFGFDLLELRKLYGLSKTKQRERLMGCIVYSPHWFRTVPPFVVTEENYILTLTWGFRRCSFRQSGQCEGLNKWNE